MWVVFRADASLQIGSGHVMRCLTLAGELRRQGVRVSFVSRLLEGHMCDHCERAGFEVFRLPLPPAVPLLRSTPLPHAMWAGVEPARDAEETAQLLARLPRSPEWLVVDHYALDVGWEAVMRRHACRIMAIDDLADRRHDCDLLLDQNLHQQPDERYRALLPERCRTLLGPGYALLRPEFAEARGSLAPRDGRVRRLHLFFGGSDPGNETAKALRAVTLLQRPELTVEVVVGASNPHREELRQLCAATAGAVFHCGVDNMAQLMSRADCAIGAGGSATWERCCLGLPTLVLSLAENQVPIARECSRAGACRYLGAAQEIGSRRLAAALRHMLQEPMLLAGCAQKGMALVDGHGAARVGERLLDLDSSC